METWNKTVFFQGKGGEGGINYAWIFPLHNPLPPPPLP